MKFWDSSALVALHVAQQKSPALRRLYARTREVLAWALSDVEVRSALCRLAREGSLSAKAMQEASAAFESFWETVHVVSALDAVRLRAKRLLGSHALRAADALQLGAALVAAYDQPHGHEFVCLDERLGDAARREGFGVAGTI